MYDRSLETLDAARLREHQWRRLRALLDEIYGAPGNAFWRAAWACAGVGAAGDLKTWDDFRRLPLSRKADVVEDQTAHPSFGTNLTYPLERYVRVHQTSGTTGAPLRWLDTQASWDWWVHCWRFVLAGAGLGRADRVYFPFSFGLFIGFWAGFEGARARRAGHSRRGRRLADAAGGHAGARRHRARLHAVLRAAPGRDGTRARRRRRRAARAGDRARGRAGGGHSGRARADSRELESARVRPRGHDRDGCLRLRMRGADRAARQRVGVHRRGAGPGDPGTGARG